MGFFSEEARGLQTFSSFFLRTQEILQNTLRVIKFTFFSCHRKITIHHACDLATKMKLFNLLQLLDPVEREKFQKTAAESGLSEVELALLSIRKMLYSNLRIEEASELGKISEALQK